MDTANKAMSTARVIGAIKITLLILNGLASFVYLILGIQMSQPSYEMTDGVMSTDGSPFGTMLIVFAIAWGTIGSLLIVAVGGFFQYLLATNAQLLARATETGGWKALGTDTHRIGESI